MLIAHGTLVLLVDGSHMKLLRNAGRDSGVRLELIEERAIHNPRDHELADAAPGRSFQSVGHERSAYSAPSPHQQREDRFGREALEVLRASEGDAAIILAAPPHMLGDLRKRIETDIHRRLIAEIDKDLTHLSAHGLADWLRDFRP